MNLLNNSVTHFAVTISNPWTRSPGENHSNGIFCVRRNNEIVFVLIFHPMHVNNLNNKQYHINTKKIAQSFKF